MDTRARERLISAWWEHHRLSTGGRAERKALSDGRPADVAAAYEAVSDLVEAGGVEALTFLADLIDARPDDAGVTVGAGPLEDLVHAHGDELVEEVLRLARQRPSFRAALASMWIAEDALTATTTERIRAMTS